MNLNFKKNNLLIIMLLIFVILSCIVFINMSNIKESFTNVSNNNRRYFVDTASDSSYNYYILNTNIYKYKLSTLPSELILESSNNVTSTNRDLTMANFRQRNLLLTYYNTETDISLLNVKNTNVSIVLDISTLPITDPSNIKTMNMIFIENSGNFYDLSNVKLSKLNMKINGELIIQNGAIVQVPPPDSDPDDTDSDPDNPVSNPNNFYNDFNLYLLRQGAFGSNYIPPIYNNFETAMNLPSNPIVNPVNTMNPLDYANSIFGPTITPTMISSMCLNQNVARVTDSNTILSETSNNLVSNLGNNRSNTNTNRSNTNSSNTNTNTNTNTNSSNTNTNTNTNTNSSNTNFNRNQNFMRESYPPYQPSQIITNSASESEFIPRPVLTDFSSFGM